MTRKTMVPLAILLILAGVAGVELGRGHGDSGGGRTMTTSALDVAVERSPGYVDGSIVTVGELGADGALALGTRSGVIRVYPTANPPLSSGTDFQWREARVTAIALSADGSIVAAEQGGLGEEPGLLAVWRLKGGVMQQISEAPSSDVWALGLSSNGNLLGVVIDGQLDVYRLTDLHEPILEGSFQIPGPYTSSLPQTITVGFNPAGTAVAVVAGEHATAWSLASWHTIWSVSCHCASTRNALSSNWEYAAFGTTDAHVLVWDLRHQQEVADVTVTDNPRDGTDAVQVDDEGDDLAAASEGSLSVWRSPQQIIPPVTKELTSGEIDNIEMTANGELMLIYKFPPPPASLTEQGWIGSGWLVRLR